ncbi:cytochrome C oxidase subunit IV family protein [Pseudomonas sp. Irchel 3E20]|uniref:cytochrome C oxidase subunit IV family protein n=1 Tax=Pseudomonas sp. Irchel 3E20 TaxID=2008983 RepID=UPI000BA3DBFA|nr:cytochrome C oxidase subunit IV family protein [Pseudomonas sp. Irchel 3E20]
MAVLMGCWLGLVLLSITTVALGQQAGWPALILLLAVAKAWMITDGFMELRHGPRLWRGLLLGWPVVLVGVVGLML